MAVILKLLRIGLVAYLVLSVIGLGTILSAYLYLAPGLPSVASLKEVQLQTPLRIFTHDGDLLGEYGEKRRKPLKLSEIPPLLQQAFIAAEDDRFFQHPGVDYKGLLRAAIHLLRTGEKGQGGSTITMQLTRNFFLSRERTYTRKLREIFLALKVERELSKQEILELYLNKIYLGNRAYGVGAAAAVYYGVNPENLTLEQMAMIAGLPKAPSSYNPIANSERALLRRNYVLGRMVELGLIDRDRGQAAMQTTISAQLHRSIAPVDAQYVGEMVRAYMVSKFSTDVYTSGYKVYTTIETKLQGTATKALRDSLLAYDMRHGYRGAEAHIDDISTDQSEWDTQLSSRRVIGRLTPGLVTQVNEKSVDVYIGRGITIPLEWDSFTWARPYIDENTFGRTPKTAGDILKKGDIIRVIALQDGSWQLAQIPEVAGAFVSLSPYDGKILALSGGYSFGLSKFNRAIQARRQPGSSFKPFIYSAALEKGFTPASVINDAPVVFNDNALEDTWRPENYSGKFYGPTRLREALTKSRNLVSIRLLNAIGKNFARDHIAHFGFKRNQLPNDLSLALGSGSVTPLQLAEGYAVFANGGYRITPYLIQRIETSLGEVIYEAAPDIACQACNPGRQNPGLIPEKPDTKAAPPSPRPAKHVISAGNAYQIVSMMQDVIRRGTGVKAMKLGRSDLAGKTGTTNDQHDAWFSGFNSDIVATAWVGFDNHKPLGEKEVGGVAALPMWMKYMSIALGGKPAHTQEQPQGMITVRIDPETGALANANNSQAIFETFRAEHVPQRKAFDTHQPSGDSGELSKQSVEIPEQLF